MASGTFAWDTSRHHLTYGAHAGHALSEHWLENEVSWKMSEHQKCTLPPEFIIIRSVIFGEPIINAGEQRENGFPALRCPMEVGNNVVSNRAGANHCN